PGRQYVQNLRGKWLVRISVPAELRNIVGARELVEKDCRAMRASASDSRSESSTASSPESTPRERPIRRTRTPPDLTLSVTAKTHLRNTLGTDEMKCASTAEMMAEHDQIVQRQAADEIGIFARRKRHDQRGC
ncbi:MAG: hypothetical protein Q8Q63_12255, partial [Phaeovulum sp.]|uniref:hypothetical protein n=1 Tax=Phaeovulum sp. TaxID=2934796 RepID=UPI002735EBA4